MHGRAIGSFLSKKEIVHSKKSKIGELLDKLLEIEYFDHFDIIFAKKLLKAHFADLANTALFLCYLSLSTRLGHICIQINSDGIIPPPKENYIKDLSLLKIFSEGEWETFDSILRNGVSECPKFIIQLVSDTMNFEEISCPIVRQENLFYIHKNYTTKKQLHNLLKTLSEQSQNQILFSKNIQESLTAFKNSNSLTPEQAIAIEKSCFQRFSFIVGGPGTGKTYTAGLLAQFLIDELLKLQSNVKLILTAPTGKASANLQTSFLRVFQHHKLEKIEIQVSTMHRLLHFLPFGILEADCILVDECSMIDLYFFQKLLDAIPKRAFIIFLGDPFQLPPIETGAVFGDIITWAESLSHSTVTRLTKCLRAESMALADFAAAIHTSDFQSIQSLADSSSISTFSLEESYSIEEQNKIIKYAEKFFPSAFSDKICPSFIKLFEEFRILSAFRSGPYGTETLNEIFYRKSLSVASHHTYSVFPILIVKNDDHLQLYNGDVGVVFRHNETKEEIALFPARSDIESYFNTDLNIRVIPKILLPSYTLAYSLSIHKSQGSEFNHALVILNKGSEIFGKEILYTAVTRAKRRLSLFVDEEVFLDLLHRSSKRIEMKIV